MTMARRKVVVFGLDVAEPDLVQEGIDAGWLPTTRRVLGSGRAALLSEPFSGVLSTSWQAVLTGFPPQEHLCLNHAQLRPGSYELEPGRDNIRQPPFWRYVSDAGLSSTTLSVYTTPLVGNVKGTQIIGWGAVDGYSTRSPSAEPPDALGVVRRAAPRRRAGLMRAVPYEPAESLDYLRTALAGVDEHAMGVRALLRETEWDVFVCGFPELHDSAHILWRFHDRAHAEHDPAAPDELKAGVRSVLQRVDARVGELLTEVPPGTTIFLLSPHGMRPISRALEATELMLERGGWVRRRSPLARGGAMTPRTVAAVRAVARRALPIGVRRALGRISPDGRARLISAIALTDVDWSATRAFGIPMTDSAQVRVNLRGREPEGIVEAGADYDRLLADIADFMTGVVDADTGEPVTDGVVITREVTGRPVGDVLPDLVISWKPGSPKRLRTPQGEVVDIPRRDRRTGEHSTTGFVIGSGPGISASGRLQLAGKIQSLLDFAPTVLTCLGVPVPQTLPGRPIESLAG